MYQEMYQVITADDDIFYVGEDGLGELMAELSADGVRIIDCSKIKHGLDGWAVDNDYPDWCKEE